MNSNLHVIVLAAGEGRRMNSARPKVLQPVGGKPMLLHLLETLCGLRPAAIHVVVGFGAEEVRAACAGLEDVPLRFPEQSRRLGTGDAVARALPEIPGDARVLVVPGDMPLIRTATLDELLSVDAELAVLSFVAADPDGYGRILRDASGRVTGICEQRDASAQERAIDEVNSGVLAATAGRLAGWLKRITDDNRAGEYYLTDCVAVAAGEDTGIAAEIVADASEALGANDRGQLAVLEAVLQQRRRRRLFDAGVTLTAPDSVQIRGEVECGRDVVVDAGVILEGSVELGDGAEIGAGCVIRDSRLAAGTRVHPYCVLDGVETSGACQIGPFARLRPGTRLAADTRIGNFVETKKAEFDTGAKASHLAYVGDARVGARANLGAGTITCNYDGAAKHHTEIGADAFIGSNSALVAPVDIGAGATIGAGSVVSRQAPAGCLTLTRARQRTVENWRRPDKKSD